VHVHLGTTHKLAHAVPLDTEILASGASGRTQLVFDTPVCAAAGDRVIIRDAAARHTLGGGRVLDANAPARRRRSAERMRHLSAVEDLLGGRGIEALLRNAPFGLGSDELERITSMPIAALTLPSQTHVLEARPQHCFLADAHWRALRDAALGTLAAFHASSPEEAGVETARLRRIAVPAMPEPSWRALIEELVTEARIARRGPWLHLPEHRVVMSAEESELATQLVPLIAAGGYDPPWVRELANMTTASEISVRRILHKLARQGGVHQIVHDLFYATERVRELAEIVAELVDEHGDVAAANFRDRTGLGRKRAIQVLEFFDRVGYTRRVHDAHRLRGERIGFF
jgi:selenocysteine-specific elongation factor